MITNFSPAVSHNRMNNKSINFQWQIPKNKLIEALDKKDASKINTILGQIGAWEKEAKLELEANKGIMREVTEKFGGNPVVHMINDRFGFKFSKK
ncbi:MAG: hypothetical protein PHE78_07460 [Candidatus Gastranaerophilales bacterium]|nr:hypothetical protein [Candidatus Gastranaerophilales bacterium]